VGARHFTQYIVADFEYETRNDHIIYNMPRPLCLVAYILDENLRHIRTIRMWREELLAAKWPPFDTSPATLFIAYSAWAELTCFMALDWRFPRHVFDLHTAYLATSNILLPHDLANEKARTKIRKRLPDACRAYNIEGWEGLDKEQVAKDIGEGRWQKYGQEYVFNYCEEDVKKSAELLRSTIRSDHRFPPANVDLVLHWANYSAKAIAQIQAHGIPWDTELWYLVLESRERVLLELRRQFDPSFYDEKTREDNGPIYDNDNQWSYKRFENWLIRHGIYAWPRLPSGELDISSDAFKLMSYIPGIERLHALRDVVGFIAKARLPISDDGRNHPSLLPFGTATGRNAHSKSPFNAHAGIRGFIKFPPDKIGISLDFRTQEVGILAAESGDKTLKAAYNTGDVYYGFARGFGLTADPDMKHRKKHNPDIRQQMKRLNLGINYGMGVASLARGLDRHPLIASGILWQHKQLYPRSWQYRDERCEAAFLDRHIKSKFGWPLWLNHSPNERTLYNFAPQSGGAEMTRLAAVDLCNADLVPCMLIHDGILFEFTNREQIELAIEIMKKAGRTVCDGFEIGVDINQDLIGGARYRDKRPMAQQMWDTIMRTLEAIGALPRRA
jgi:hypothetical protein